MARIKTVDVALQVVAQSDAELALMDHGRHSGGVLILLGAEYRVLGHRLLLPEDCAKRTANKVKDAFERAALSHQQAQGMRRKIRVV